jgi:hypothetical protein
MKYPPCLGRADCGRLHLKIHFASSGEYSHNRVILAFKIVAPECMDRHTAIANNETIQSLVDHKARWLFLRSFEAK